MSWDPEQYLKFQAERFAPFDDCLELVMRRERLRVIDLGCGTGELTRRLADALPESDVLGIDSSAEMLARAESQARPGLRFERRQIEELEGLGGTWDLIFSHAALQWVDDHERLIPRLVGHLSTGGQLVVQMPSNHGHVAHRELHAAAAQAPYGDALENFSRGSPVRSIDFYAEALYAAGGRQLTVYEKVYPHVLPDAAAVTEWIRGTAMVPYLERLPEKLREPFIAEVRARLQRVWPAGPVFYGFRRTLFSATRA